MGAGDQPVFPCNVHRTERGEEWQEHVPGMTLRQHYAGVALQGYLAGRNASAPSDNYTRHDVARACWDYADALAAEGKR